VKSPISRLERAIRICSAVLPALRLVHLFQCKSQPPCSLWVSAGFHIASAATPFFTSFEVYPFPNGDGLAEHPSGPGKVMNLHRDPYGRYKLVSFRAGDWEHRLLLYVGAQLGLLTLGCCNGTGMRA
jgi:hypothetical protein